MVTTVFLYTWVPLYTVLPIADRTILVESS